MLHEIEPSIFSNNYKEIFFINEDDFVLHYSESKILLKKTEDGFEIPRSKDFPESLKEEELVYLHSLNESNCFLLKKFVEKRHNKKNKFVFEDTVIFRNFSKQDHAWIGSVGIQLDSWYKDNRFCGRCGTRMQHKEDERALKCLKCGSIVYPKISPAVIVAITCNDKILLAKGKNSRLNFYALIAGFVEIGETFEEAVVREVKEEIGIDVKNIRYYKSQPWPYSSSMMIGFFAEGDDTQKIVLEENEIAEAAWYKRGELPAIPSKISIAGEMIDIFEKMTEKNKE